MTLNTRANFMMVVAVVFGIYSLLWGLAPYTSINLPAKFILDISDWPLDSLSLPLDRNTMWLTSISSGLLAAVSVFLGGVVAPAIREGNKVIINTTILAMVVWYLIDTVGFIASGVVSNAVLNTVYLALVLTPLVCFQTKPINQSDTSNN